MIFLFLKSKKDKLEGISLVFEIVELDYVFLVILEFQLDFIDGIVEVIFVSVVDNLVVIVFKGFRFLEFKDKILEVFEKMIEKFESMKGEGKKEDKSRMVELMKGYMRFIKFRGFSLLLLKFVIQERERVKLLKFRGRNLLWGKCVFVVFELVLKR